MNAKDDTASRSGLLPFSDRPLLHYFLAIGITSIAASLFFSFRTYECLNSGNAYDCRYDPGSPAMIAAHDAGMPNDLSILRNTVFISTFEGMISFLTVLVLCAPVSALGYFASLRCRVRRNMAGVAFWTGAWILAFLVFPILVGIGALFNPGHTSWAVDLFQGCLFVMQGLFCGIVYCALAFFHRDKAVIRLAADAPQ